MLQLLVLWQCYQVVVNIIKRDAYHNENRNGDDAADNNDDNDDLRIISEAAALVFSEALVEHTCSLSGWKQEELVQ